MAEIIKDKYIVIKKEHALNYLSWEEQEQLEDILNSLSCNMAFVNPKGNTYYVCNTDEPYADKVLKVILDGEDEKTRMLSTVEKLNLINSMEVVEDSCSSGELEYVTVDDNETNRDILHKLGLTDEKIKSECCPENGELDIGIIAFTEAGASYYDFKEKRFH